MRMNVHKACGFIFLLIMIAGLMGCGAQQSTGSSPVDSPSTDHGNETTDQLPQMTKIKLGAAQITTQDFLPWFVGMEKGIYKKYNLDVSLESVEGGVVALRGLQAGDYQFIASLPESVISGVSKGAAMKIIGTLSDQTLFKVFVTPDIRSVEDLKGKAAAVLQPGNGTDVQMRWWLQQHGLEPDKDVRIISAGGNPARLAALKSGQVKVTLFTPPTDIEAEKAGMKQMAVMRDELKSYNQDTIVTTDKLIKENPALIKAFMEATAEAIAYVKDPDHYDEVVQIAVKHMGFSEEVTKRSLDFVMPSIPDKAKLNTEGIKLAIELTKRVGVLDKDITVEDVVNESFYAQ
ncbi:ABC transporter substrate-binding protein [Bacillaceae bacterium]